MRKEQQERPRERRLRRRSHLDVMIENTTIIFTTGMKPFIKIPQSLHKPAFISFSLAVATQLKTEW